MGVRMTLLEVEDAKSVAIIAEIGKKNYGFLLEYRAHWGILAHKF